MTTQTSLGFYFFLCFNLYLAQVPSFIYLSTCVVCMNTCIHVYVYICVRMCHKYKCGGQRTTLKKLILSSHDTGSRDPAWVTRLSASTKTHHGISLMPLSSSLLSFSLRPLSLSPPLSPLPSPGGAGDQALSVF